MTEGFLVLKFVWGVDPEDCLRSQVAKDHEVFEEITLLDLRLRYGETEAGRRLFLELLPQYASLLVGSMSKTSLRRRRA